MNKKTQRMILDVALTILIIAAMLIQLTGETLHEIVGALFFVAVVAHLALSFKWMKGSARLAKKGKLKGHTLGLVIMAALLALDMLVLGYSSIMISRILASVGLASSIMSSFWRDVHTVSSYLLSALTVAHLAMHWATLFSWAKVPYNPSRRVFVSTGVNAIAAVGVIALATECAKAMELIPGTDEAVTAAEEAAAMEVVDTPAPSSVSVENEKQATAGAGESAEASSSAAEDAAASESRESSSSSSSSKPSGPSSASSPSSSSSGSGSSSSGSTVTGTCTLCKKRCPLSAPLCDRPYLEGLL